MLVFRGDHGIGCGGNYGIGCGSNHGIVVGNGNHRSTNTVSGMISVIWGPFQCHLRTMPISSESHANII